MVVNSIERFLVFDTRSLFSMQELLIAGFRSRHKSIVNKAIAMWNSTFGGEDGLEYPEGLGKILQKLKFVAELRLPNFPDMTVGEVSELDLATFNAKADLARACRHLCISLTHRTKKRYTWSLARPSLELLHQLLR